jgi:hypothetical protein
MNNLPNVPELNENEAMQDHALTDIANIFYETFPTMNRFTRWLAEANFLLSKHIKDSEEDNQTSFLLWELNNLVPDLATDYTKEVKIKAIKKTFRQILSDDTGDTYAKDIAFLGICWLRDYAKLRSDESFVKKFMDGFTCFCIIGETVNTYMYYN